jgi:arylsulfatase A-like enzyme
MTGAMIRRVAAPVSLLGRERREKGEFAMSDVEATTASSSSPSRRAVGTRRGFALFGATLLIAAAATSLCCSGTKPAGPTLVLLISIDTCRADRLGVAGAKLADGTSPTPQLDRLAADGRFFPEALTPAPLTLPAHVTVMSGLYPDRHGVRENDSFRVPKPEARRYRLLAERLRDEGYDTAAFVAAQPLDRRFGLDQGFRVYDDVDRKRARGGGVLFRERDAEAVTDAAAAWLAATKDVSHRFLFVHYFDPHFPYERRADAPASIPPGTAGDYLAEIWAVDRAVGRLLAALPDSGRSAFVVVCGDHGEGLGENGERTHGYFLHDSVLRVPLIVKPPAGIPAPVARPARLVDVAPTILAAARLSADGLEGENLLAPPTRPFRDRAETLYAYYQHRYARLRAFRDETWKLTEGGGRAELASWRAAESRLAVEREAEAARLRALLFEALAAAGAEAAPAASDPLDVSGPYHGARSPSSPVEPTEDENRALPHPADRTDVLRDLDEARILVQRGEPAKAALILRSRGDELERNPALLLWTGRAVRDAAGDPRLSEETRRRDLREAEGMFRLLAEKFGDPRGVDLALLCLRDAGKTGDRAAYEEMVRYASAEIVAKGGSALTFALRGLAREALGNLEAARQDLEIAAAREPEDPKISADLARVRGLLGTKANSR